MKRLYDLFHTCVLNENTLPEFPIDFVFNEQRPKSFVRYDKSCYRHPDDYVSVSYYQICGKGKSPYKALENLIENIEQSCLDLLLTAVLDRQNKTILDDREFDSNGFDIQIDLSTFSRRMIDETFEMLKMPVPSGKLKLFVKTTNDQLVRCLKYDACIPLCSYITDDYYIHLEEGLAVLNNEVLALTVRKD